jgi:hypothetical protein
MVENMPVRRFAFAVLTALLVLAAAAPAAAATGRGGGVRRMLRLLRAQPAIERVAVRDVDNDGRLDIVAAPRQGGLMVWRNRGKGRFVPAAPTRAAYRLPARGPRFGRVHHCFDESGQWDDERYDAAMPRAPGAGADVVPVSFVHPLAASDIRPASLRPSSGRAPPIA